MLQKFVPLPQQLLKSSEQALAYINKAETPEERQSRKAECLAIIYGAGPRKLGELFPHSTFCKA